MPSPSMPNNRLAVPAVAAINHLLAQEAWARDVLVLHAGKVAFIDAGSPVLAVRMQVTRDGMLAAAEPGQPANVTIRMKLSDLPLIAQNRDRAFSYVTIEGDAEFANTISQLSKTLRWEAEHDLEKLTGPIVARRIVEGARDVAEQARSTQRKLSENLVEYFLDEQPVLVRPAMLEALTSDVCRLRDDVERAAKRIARLEQGLLARGAGVKTAPAQAGNNPGNPVDH
ncbi:sterol-binding protein [Massilia psychrophila]|uniref:Ubiquinone biosynthesis accessory factor UbiJ n=2 Tax=Massilia psychrophila TaxID=1603353 RepID=A0A2G8SWD2_9BURK|nr:sterol-binding protein [Massilia psychrophila]